MCENYATGCGSVKRDACRTPRRTRVSGKLKPVGATRTKILGNKQLRGIGSVAPVGLERLSQTPA